MITRFRNLVTLMSICLFVLIGCDKNEDQARPLRNVQFKIATPKSIGGKIAAFNPDALLISIENASGVSFYSMEKVEIYQLNDGYISFPVSLPQGSYKLTLFALVDNDDNIIAATPTEDSPVAEFVTDPLPIEFEVTAEETTYLNPEVLVVEEGMDFGYAVFGIEVVKIFPVTVSVFGNDGDIRNLISASLIIEGYKDGGISWTKSVELEAGENLIYTKGEMDYYNFIVEAPEYYSLSHEISSGDLKNNPDQVFDLIKVGTQFKSIQSEVYCCPGSGFNNTKIDFTYNSKQLLTKVASQYQNNDQWYQSTTIDYLYSGGLVPNQVKYKFEGSTYLTFNNTMTDGVITSAETFKTGSSIIGSCTISLTRDPITNHISDAVLYDKDYYTTLNYNYTYNSEGDLVMFEVRYDMNNELLYRGEFTYDNYSNVYPQHMLGKWLEDMTNAEYSNLVHIPFMINKPKHNIVSYTLSMFTGAEVLNSREIITMNYGYDIEGRPVSLQVLNEIETPGYSTVEIERQKNTVFQYQ